MNFGSVVAIMLQDGRSWIGLILALFGAVVLIRSSGGRQALLAAVVVAIAWSAIASGVVLNYFSYLHAHAVVIQQLAHR